MKASQACAIWLASACFKLLMWPAYRSTDFAVHANWLSLTHSKPVSKWYVDESSRWTLDYPPLFAWFEYAMSTLLFPPQEMLQRLNGEEESTECWRNKTASETCFSPSSIVWHRFSVAFTEFLVLGLGVYWFCNTWPPRTTSESSRTYEKITAALLLCAFDPNLLILDHVHFQYNGYLMGILILSLAALRDGRAILGAFLFAVLLAHKHIFLYAAPLYFVYLLANYCLSYDVKWFVAKVSVLGIAVLSVFIPSLFSICSIPTTFEDGKVFIGCVKQIGTRLFPVQERGLVHAYWAPNFWALYAGTDRVLRFVSSLWGIKFDNHPAKGISSTDGLVQGEIRFDVLPQIPPLVTGVLSLLGMLPALFRVWRCRQPQLLVHAYCCCVMSCIFFGYHVHEKALLMVSLPLTLCALDSAFDARCYLMLTWITEVALAPLLFPRELSSFKLLLVVTHTICAFSVLDWFHTNRKRESRIKNSGLMSLCLRFVDAVYLTGLALVFCLYEYGPMVERLVVERPEKRVLERYPFLPLMAVSIYCAVGVLKCWIDLYLLLGRKQQAIESYGNSPQVKPMKYQPQ